MAKDSDKTKDFEELQIIQQNLQNILMQKQAFQYELTETESALNEIKNSKDDVYKIVGQLMLRSPKDSIVEELSNREKLLKIRLESLQKQEDKLSNKLQELQEKLM
ncbi:prefoldin subunit beta [Candidatus Pacearchaeota archaeon CG10_big_fil_rev_8_21_14_0_10_32_14]|nr:MAG: prefoldin subunit beta [Candidatus Pacearchaeota archaeon CG10_big_fil_rev_8_21_14_0_10_32_14]